MIGRGWRHLLQTKTQALGTLLLALLLSFILGAIIIRASGDSPLATYYAMLAGAFGSKSRLASTLAKATPLILTGLAASVASSAGVRNIGIEGQLYLGGFAAAWVGFTVGGIPSALHVLLCLVAAALAGAAWAFVPAFLKVRSNTNEIVVTIMANYVAILFTGYLVNYPFKAPGSVRSATVFIAKSAELPRLVSLSRFSLGFFIAVGMLALIHYMMTKTTLGYELKMVGLNPEFAQYGGIQTGGAMLTAMLISGALGGIAGAVEVMGVHHRFIDNLSLGYGYEGLLIALIAGGNPIRVFLVAIIFGALRTGAIGMEQVTSIPSELSSVIQSLIILCVAAQAAFRAFPARLRKEQSACHTAVR